MLERLTSALGIVVMLLLAFAACPAQLRKDLSRRTLLGGLGLLLLVAVLVLRAMGEWQAGPGVHRR